MNAFGTTLARILPGIASRPSRVWLLCTVIGLALYLFTLPYPFIFDDRVLLLNNPLLMQGTGFRDLVNYDDFVATYLPRLNDIDTVTSFALRPAAYLSFRINYLLGGFHPAGFRAVNIVIHVLNAILFYHLLREIFVRRSEGEPPSYAVTIPLFAALLFLCHPLHTEAVTYIVQRFTSLGTSFYLICLLLYLHAGSGQQTTGMRRRLYVLAMVVFLAGLLVKEFLVTLPVSLLLLETVLLRRKIRDVALRIAPFVLCAALLPAMVLTMSQDISGDAGLGNAARIVNATPFSTPDYLITQSRVILSYLRLLAVPYNLNFDPDYPLFTSLAHPEILVSLLVWLLFLTAAITLFRKKDRTILDDLRLFSLLWFPLLIAVSSSVIPLPDLMTEHRTYLPSLAFFTGLLAHLHSIALRWDGRVGIPRLAIGLVIVVSILCMLTVQRNQVYSSRLTLWQDTVEKSPAKARPALALANAYEDAGRDDQALFWAQRAVELNPAYVEPRIALGNLFHKSGRHFDAISVYENYLGEHAPERRILSNLALTYSEVGMFEKAVYALEHAIMLDPDDERLQLIMAEHLVLIGRMEEARDHLSRARELDASNPFSDMSMAISMMERYFQGSSALREPERGRVRS